MSLLVISYARDISRRIGFLRDLLIFAWSLGGTRFGKGWLMALEITLLLLLLS